MKFCMASEREREEGRKEATNPNNQRNNARTTQRKQQTDQSDCSRHAQALRKGCAGAVLALRLTCGLIAAEEKAKEEKGEG